MSRVMRASIACMLGLLPGCEFFESSSLSASQALWTQVSVRYVHQGVSKGPALITSSNGAVLEERRYEPFGEPVDALRDGVPAPSASLELEPHNALNQPTDPRTGFSYHGARWMVPGTARWLSPDPAVKAPDKKLMVTPWDLNPYQYVAQNPTLFWDPDGKRKALTEQEKFFVEVGMVEGQRNWQVNRANPPPNWNGGCVWNFCRGIKWLFDRNQSCGQDIDASVARLQNRDRAGATQAFQFQGNAARGNVRPANPGAIYQGLTQATGTDPGTYLFAVSISDNQHGGLLVMERKANGHVSFAHHDQVTTRTRTVQNDAQASVALDDLMTGETQRVSRRRPLWGMELRITEIHPEPEP